MLKRGLAPWKKRSPPKLKLEHVEDNRFALRTFQL